MLEDIRRRAAELSGYGYQDADADADAAQGAEAGGLEEAHPHAEGAVLVVPQLTALASWGGLSRLLAATHSRGESGSNGRLRCGREGRPKSPMLWPSTPRHTLWSRRLPTTTTRPW